MLTVEVERAVRRLETCTGELAAAELSDLKDLAPILESRAAAIMHLAAVLERSSPASLNTLELERLSSIVVQGEEARRRILMERKHSAAEWTRLSAVRQAVGSEQTTPAIDIDL